MFRNRIIYSLTGIIFIFLLITIFLLRLGNSSGLGALVPLLIFYQYLGLLAAPIIVIFFFIGYRKDISKKSKYGKSNFVLELIGIILGIILSWFFMSYIGPYFFGPYGLVDAQNTESRFSLFSLVSALYVFIYAYIGFILPKVISNSFRIKKNDLLVALLLFIFTFPIFIFAFYRLNFIQKQESQIQSELKLSNFKENNPVLESDNQSTTFAIDADLYTAVAGNYEVLVTDEKGTVGFLKTKDNKFIQGWQPVMIIFSTSYNCPQSGTDFEREFFARPATKRKINIEFRLQPQNTSFPALHYETIKAYKESDFYLQCKK